MVAALALGGCTPAVVSPHIETRPRRVMSLNLCTDRLLLALVPRARIASVTWLAEGADARIARNHARAEDVLHDRPNLILSYPWTGGVARGIAGRADIRVMTIEPPTDFATIRLATLDLGRALGAVRNARAQVAAMDTTLADLQRGASRRRWRVALWSGAGLAPVGDPLTRAILAAAGATQVTAPAGGGIEALLAARPDAVLIAGETDGAPSLDRARTLHPVLRRAFAGRIVHYPADVFGCGLPASAAAARDLRRALERLPARPSITA